MDLTQHKQFVAGTWLSSAVILVNQHNPDMSTYSLRPPAKFCTIPCTCHLTRDRTSPYRCSLGWEPFWDREEALSPPCFLGSSFSKAPDHRELCSHFGHQHHSRKLT